MWRGKNKRVAVWLLIAWLASMALDALWDNAVRPLIALNVEQWAVRRGYDQYFNRALETPWLGRAMTVVAEAASATYSLVTSGYALAFILGCLFIAFFDWLVWPFRSASQAGPFGFSAGDARQQAAATGELVLFIHSKVSPAHHELTTVLHNLAQRLWKHHLNLEKPLASAVGQNSKLIRSHVLEIGVARHKELLDLVNAGKQIDAHHLQERLDVYYRDYHNMMVSMHNAANLLVFDLKTDPNFRRWRKHDEQLVIRLREIVSDPRYFTLEEIVRPVGWGEGYRNG